VCKWCEREGHEVCVCVNGVRGMSCACVCEWCKGHETAGQHCGKCMPAHGNDTNTWIDIKQGHCEALADSTACECECEALTNSAACETFRRTHTHTHTHTDRRTRTQTDVHAQALHTSIQADASNHTNKPSCLWLLRQARTQIHSHMHTCACTYSHIYTFT